MSTFSRDDRTHVARWQRGSLLVGVGAAVVCVIGGFFNTAPFFRAYLAAYLFYLGMALGCLAILMVYFLTGGAWGLLIRRILEAGTRTLPLFAILFLPIAFGISSLYEWAQPQRVAADPELQQKQFYLRPDLFWLRAAAYFVVWIGLAFVLDTWSRRQDAARDPSRSRRLVRFSGLGLLAYGLSLHFASIDWLMSLETGFKSTIFGPLVASSQVLSGLALALVCLRWLVRRPPLSEVVSLKAMNDLGSLLFSFLIIWAYMVWFQFMLIWIADMRTDNTWYLDRFRDGWQWVTYTLVIVHFVIPFFVLLLRVVKRNPDWLGAVAALILVMHVPFSFYQVMPAFQYEESLVQHWIDVFPVLALGGIWLAVFLWQLQRRPLLPPQDLNIKTAVHLRHLDIEEAERDEEVLAHG